MTHALVATTTDKTEGNHMFRTIENFANTPESRTVITAAASTEDRRLAPIALQRWESDGGALPA